MLISVSQALISSFPSVSSCDEQKTTIMIQLFPLSIKHFFSLRNISFNNPLSKDEFQLLETYYLNNLNKSCFHSYNNIPCKSPNLKYICSYSRNYIIFKNNTVIENRVDIPVVYCSSCRHCHAILPHHFISPRCQYSIPFILHVIFDKFHSNLTAEKICSKYHIAMSTLYRWLDKYSCYLNYYVQLRNKYIMHFFVSLLYFYEELLNDIFDICASAFFQFNRKLFSHSFAMDIP